MLIQRVVCCALLCSLMQGVMAEEVLSKDTSSKEEVPRLPKWELGAGVGAFSLPDYRGSSHQGVTVLPIPYFIYRGEVIRASRNGVSARLFDTDKVDVDFSLGGGVPVKSKNNPERAGMPDLPGSIEFGPQLIVRALGAEKDDVRVDLRLPVRQVLTVQGEGKGLVATPALNLSITPKDGWQIGAQVGAYFGSRPYHRFVYGVDSQYANATRPAYEAKAGYGGWQTTASLSRRFEKLWIGAFVRMSSVSGAVFDNSPLVSRRYNYSAGIGVSWVFKQSAEMVSRRDED